MTTKYFQSKIRAAEWFHSIYRLHKPTNQQIQRKTKQPMIFGSVTSLWTFTSVYWLIGCWSVCQNSWKGREASRQRSWGWGCYLRISWYFLLFWDQNPYPLNDGYPGWVLGTTSKSTSLTDLFPPFFLSSHPSRHTCGMIQHPHAFWPFFRNYHSKEVNLLPIFFLFKKLTILNYSTPKIYGANCSGFEF